MQNLDSFKTVMWPVKDLKPAEYNPRKINQAQLDRLKRSIQENGFLEPLLVNTYKDRKGVVIGGHQRLKALIELGVVEIPCVEASFPLKKEKSVNVQMNKLGGDFDFDMLAEHFEMEELEDMGFEKFEFNTNKLDIDSFLIDSPEEVEEKIPPKIEVTHTCPKCGHEFK